MIHTFVLSKDKKFYTGLPNEKIKNFLQEKSSLVWVDLEQATEEENAVLSDVFNFHPLAIEDCLNITHHPKIDKFENYLFIVMHAFDFGSMEKEISTLELNLFLGKNFVVTYHARPIRSVIQTKEKCLNNYMAVMGKGADFLVYNIFDALVDNFIPTLNTLDHRIDELEEEVFFEEEDFLSKVNTVRNDVLYLRKIIRPQRNTINLLTRSNEPFIEKEKEIYFRDVYDQLYRIYEQCDNYRDIISGILDMHLSLSSNKMNQIMKTLTIVMTIMLPLTLITGIYGMNFKYMPELNYKYSYFIVLGAMAVIALLLIYYMKKKKWF